MSREPDAAGVVEDRLFSALALLRGLLALNAVVLYAYRRDNVEVPWLGGLLIGGVVVWTVVAWWAYGKRRRRTPLLLLLDLAVALALLLGTPLAKGPDFQATIPGFWIAAAVLAWAIRWRVTGGLVSAALLCAADLLSRQRLEQNNIGNVFLVVLAGAMVGYLTDSLITMATERDAALREAAAGEERARLARAVHDGVLQVLALVQRRGRDLGGEYAALGALAGEQETALRTLIRAQDAVAVESLAAGPLDLVARLQGWERQASPRTSVSAPGVPVPLPAEVVRELDAAVGECLSNVRHHVGAEASAWVLVEDRGSTVAVTVRDQGPGIPLGRLEAAEREGRLGVSASIRGRMADLGGTATLDTGTFGTAWELVVPSDEEPR